MVHEPQDLADSPVGLLGWNAQLMTADAIGDRQLDDGFILTNTALYRATGLGLPGDSRPAGRSNQIAA